MAKTNEQVAQAWVNGETARSASMRTDGQTLWSYQTEIAWLDREHGIAYLTPERYSTTTSTKHMPAVGRAVREVGFRVIRGRNFEDYERILGEEISKLFNMRCARSTIGYVLRDLGTFQTSVNRSYQAAGKTAPLIRPPVEWLQRAVRLGVEVPFDMWRLAYGEG